MADRIAKSVRFVFLFTLVDCSIERFAWYSREDIREPLPGIRTTLARHAAGMACPYLLSYRLAHGGDNVATGTAKRIPELIGIQER